MTGLCRARRVSLFITTRPQRMNGLAGLDGLATQSDLAVQVGHDGQGAGMNCRFEPSGSSLLGGSSANGERSGGCSARDATARAGEDPLG